MERNMQELYLRGHHLSTADKIKGGCCYTFWHKPGDAEP